MQQYTTLPQMLALLDQKGFNEDALHMGGKPGTIATELTGQHLLMQEAALAGKPLNTLYAYLPGRFDKGRDHVEFSLVFHYDSNSQALKLRSVSAVMNHDQAKKLYVIANPALMYHTHEMVQQLSEIRATRAVEVYLGMQVKNNPQKVKHL